MQAKKLVNACFGAKKACTYCNIKRAIKPVKSTTIELFSKHYLLNNIEAAEELEKIAAVCKTTKLSIAAMMGANALRLEMMGKHECSNCRHSERMPGMYPCDGCSSDHDKWERR